MQLIELTRDGQRALVNEEQLPEWLGMGWKRKADAEAKPKRPRKKAAKEQEKVDE